MKQSYELEGIVTTANASFAWVQFQGWSVRCAVPVGMTIHVGDAVRFRSLIVNDTYAESSVILSRVTECMVHPECYAFQAVGL